MRRPAVRPGSLSILHEDEDLLVVDKPAGLLSSRTPDDERDSLFDMVKEHVRGGRRKPVRVWIIHRLDKEASGLLVFAKSEKTFNWLKEDFRAKRMHRLYMAVVEGEITGAAPEAIGAGEQDADAEPAMKQRFKQLPSGTIQSFIKDDEFGNVTSVGIGEVARESVKGRRASAPPPRGVPPAPHRGRFMGPLDDDAPRLAVTHYRVLGTGDGRSLLQLRLDTGRKNQIRIHMQEFKHPIIGDARFGATSDPIGRLALHASELAFTHPATGQTVRFNSPAPASFYRALGMQPPKTAPEEAQPVQIAPAPPAPARAAAEQLPPDASPTPTLATPAKSSPSSSPAGALPETSWDHVAAWYDLLIEEDRSDHFRHTIIPGTLRLLRPPQQAGFRVLDIACGQGALCRRMAQLGVDAVGVDASARLIAAARRHTQGEGPARFEVGDARFLGSLPPDIRGTPFDAASCVMALMNIDPLEPVLRGAASLLKPGGAFVAVILHPAFRAPGQTSWQWDYGRESAPPQRGPRSPGPRSGPPRAEVRQFRRVDGYLSTGQTPITMNPGSASRGAAPVTTWTFHRPIQSYVKALADAGFLIEAIEEWPSMRQSQPGPRAAEENRARREIPMFLGIRAVRRG